MLGVLLIVVVNAALAASQGPTLKDCHPSGNSAVKITNPKLEPYPPVLPGKVKISADVEVTRPLDKFDVNVTVIKDLNGFPLRIPCLENVGSCIYENFCQVLEETFPDGNCPPVVTQCRCPFKANKIQIRGLELELPALPPEIGELVTGKYEIFLSLQDSGDKSVLSCLNVKLEIRAGRLYLV